MPGLKAGRTTEASSALDAIPSRRLVFGWSVETNDACSASGAKLRGGGVHSGSRHKGPCIPSAHRHLGCRRQTAGAAKPRSSAGRAQLNILHHLAGPRQPPQLAHQRYDHGLASVRRPSAVGSRDQWTNRDPFGRSESAKPVGSCRGGPGGCRHQPIRSRAGACRSHPARRSGRHSAQRLCDPRRLRANTSLTRMSAVSMPIPKTLACACGRRASLLSGLIGADDPLDRSPRLVRFIAPALQQLQQSLRGRIDVLQRPIAAATSHFDWLISKTQT